MHESTAKSIDGKSDDDTRIQFVDFDKSLTIQFRI